MRYRGKQELLYIHEARPLHVLLDKRTVWLGKPFFPNVVLKLAHQHLST